MHKTFIQIIFSLSDHYFMIILIIIFSFVSFIAEEYSDHPNEVVKNEELTYNGVSSAHRRPQDNLLRFICLTTITLMISILLPNLMR